MIYIGFDLGDGESCLHYSESNRPPIALPVAGETSFLSAVASLDGRTVVGKTALNEKATGTRVCFKRHFLEGSAEYAQAITDFARGILDDIRNSGIAGVSEFIGDPEKVCFVVGCPAGWSAQDRDRYKGLLENAGMRNVSLTSESRAAFESFAANQAFKVERALFNQSVLVIDIGSSTLDFSFVKNGNEQEVKILGNTLLGGGMMDEMLLINSVKMIPDPELRRTVEDALEHDPAAKSKLMVVTRKMKEDYFSNEDEYLIENREYTKQALIVHDRKVLRFNLRISPDIVENFVKSYPHPLLSNQTFENRLQGSLATVKERLKEFGAPKLVILTGGPSRMRFFQDMCREAFPQSRVVVSNSPESDISQGLCMLGHMDSSLGRFIADVSAYVQGDGVEKHVEAAMPQLIDDLSGAMTNAIFTNCVLPTAGRWLDGRIDTLNGMSKELEGDIELYARSDAMKTEVQVRTQSWVKTLLPDIQKDIDTIASEHRVKNNVLRLDGVSVESKGPIGGTGTEVDFKMIDLIVTAVTTVVCGMICGGAGVALIASGPVGIIIGAIIGLVAGVSGAAYFDQKLKDWKLPVFMRRAISINSINSDEAREKVRAQIKSNFKSDTDLLTSLTGQISKAIDSNISKTVEKMEAQM